MTGFVCIDKPQGITSFVAVAKLRRLFSQKKAGHTGTLDPMATGVLTVALGGATRFIELIPNHDKSYRATFLLGKTTDTLDITGNIIEENEVTCTRADVEQALDYFKGDIKQLPPMYSAIKKNGVRLYDLARQGIEIEREERQITIYSLSLVSCDEQKNEYIIDVSCSCGTYIRSLVSDIGDKLGCGAVMTALERTSANSVGIERCFTFDQLEEMYRLGTLEKAITSVDKMLGYKNVTVTEAQAKRFSNGGELDLNRVKCEKKDGYYNVYSPAGSFLGVGEISVFKGILKVKRVYSER